MEEDGINNLFGLSLGQSRRGDSNGGGRRTGLLALAEELAVVLMHDLEKRLFQLLLPTRRRR